jgi:glycosyltransferase involved in cell wall biosynthesis
MTASQQINPNGISVILPNYNHAAQLKTSLTAIVEQSQPFDEVLIVDDASTDGSLNIIAAFANRCPQLRVMRHERRMGVAAAVNRGLSEALNPYVIMASADEKVARNLSSVFHDVLAMRPGIKLAVSCYSEWNEKTNVTTNYGLRRGLGMWYAPNNKPFFVSADQFRSLLKTDFVWLGVNTAMFARETLREVGGFDPDLHWHSDWFAIYTIAFRHGFCAVPKTLASFRFSESSYSTRGMRDTKRQKKVMYALVAKMGAPAFSDIGHAVRHTPSALSPFIRYLMPALFEQPAQYGLMAHLVVWWLGQFVRLRRPGVLLGLREFIARRLRKEPSQKFLTLMQDAERFEQASLPERAL